MMDKEQSLEYCYKHKSKYISELIIAGDDPETAIENFNCLIALVEDETVTYEDLADYGMDYKDNPNG